MGTTARCGCTSTTCSCAVTGGVGVSVLGKGSVGNPYRINIDSGKLTVDQTPTIHLNLSGSGISTDWYHLSAVLTGKLDDLADVAAPTPAAGQVLAWDNTAKNWHPVPPATAAPGAIAIGVGLGGDGSAATPLSAKANAAAGIQVDGNGIGIQSGIMSAINGAGSIWTPYNPTARRTDTNAIVPTSSEVGRYCVRNRLCICYGSLTLSAAVDNLAITLPVKAYTRILNAGVLRAYASSASAIPGDQTGVARILSGSILDQIVLHAYTGGFRGVSSGASITWNVAYETT